MGFRLPKIKIGKFLGKAVGVVASAVPIPGVGAAVNSIIHAGVDAAKEAAKTRASAVIAGSPLVKNAVKQEAVKEASAALPLLLGGALVFMFLSRRR